MKRVKQAARAVLLAALLCVMLTAPAFAAGDGSVWATLSETSDGTIALIVTDTTVTDGVVSLTYDSSALTYEGVTVDEAYVAMYAVNADEAGVVRISWVAPGEYEAAGGRSLMQVSFAGKGAVSLSGEASNGEGASVPVAGVKTPADPTDPAEPANPTDPANPADPAAPEAPGSNGLSPGTGDRANIALPIAAMACAAAAIVVMIGMKRRTAK